LDPLEAADWEPVLHEQHSEAPASETSVSGTVDTVSPWEIDPPWAHELRVPWDRPGSPDPVLLAAMEHEHYSARVLDLTCPSLVLMPVWAKATAESPRRMRVCFILSNLL
jgi:hypothetical protein